ncbi:MAG: chromosome segregation protein SMC [Christensenellales bacterium]
MHFKQIEIAGFKSFADRIDIKFDSGVTAIVGPNGCGKSNVADAIRWVLGEQSSKQLRGSSMQDVIFNGTKKRKSLSYCEATLTFNNQDRFFDFDYDEVAVTRKLYRSGESEYLINKQQSRLKDIINLFYDSGIGRDGYSIIGQGKVEEIISSKPETRRLIFEEAAGIAKYKSRKVEAERKLERTKDNLTRLRDIIFELEKQLGPLKKQAETAKKYLEFKHELKDLEVNAYIYQFENASQAKKQINDKLNGILEQLDLRQAEYDQVNENYEKSMLEIEQLDSKINALHQKILTLTVQLEKQSSEARVIKERTIYLQEQNLRLATDIGHAELKIKSAQLTKQEKQNKIYALMQEEKVLQAEIEKAQSNLNEVLSKLDFLEGQTAQDTKSILDSVETLTDIKSAVSSLKAEREMLLSSQTETKDKIAFIENKYNEFTKTKEQIKEVYSKAKAQSEEFEKNHGILTFKLSSLNNELKETEQEKTNLFAKVQVYENRKRLLTEMQAEFEGYAHSVRKLLKESERSPEIKNKIIGVLANLIKVPVNLETAIEVALGAAVQNIVTFDEKGAKQLIEHLKQNNYGRATFLPITTMKPRSLSNYELNALNMKGVVGVASQLVHFDKQISSVIENLLGAVIIVENLDVALELAAKINYSAKIVTLDGGVVNTQGSLTGGSRKDDSANLIAREREIQTLAKEIEKVKILHQQTLEKIKNLTGMIKSITGQIEDNSLLKAQADIVLAKENEKLLSLQNTMQTYENDRLENQNKLYAIAIKLEKIEKDLILLAEKEKGSKVVSTTDFSEKDKQRLEQLNTLKEQRDNLQHLLTQNKIKFASSNTESLSLQEDIKRIEEEIVSTQIMLEGNKNVFEKNKNTIEEANLLLRKELEQASNSAIVSELEKAKQNQQNLSSNKQNMQNNVRALNEERTVVLNTISNLKEKKFAQEAALTKVDTDIETMQERIFEEYQLDYEACLEFKKENFDLNPAIQEINRLKREINKLGYVNVNAIEDVKEVAERYTTLSTQEADLLKAENDLNEIITSLSKEMEDKFKQEFDKINANFKVTFRELFGGGNASLELLDPENVLDSGVEINAEPPGKNLKSITLLSGGEKALTAIAILFAILKMRPMPFCLLDEIEAALDEANVQRFAEYLKKFAKTTQFIVITHRKPTMELADSLYGVTMEEEGVSRMVSVKLSDAVLNAKSEAEEAS